jgi:uncharacterized protein YndB with AHSA1/START domain
MEKDNRKIAGIGSDAVKKATGRGWDQWLAVLDKAKATKLSHKEIASILRTKHDVPMWWSQMITVGYEQARGLRKAHETSEGFEISKSATLPVSPIMAFNAWNDREALDTWLGEDFTIRKATPGKSMRITWIDGKTNVDVNFYHKGKSKCQVSVQHTKLPSAARADKIKKYWAAALNSLGEYLENK